MSIKKGSVHGSNQEQINNAAEGASITLTGSDTNLQITRAITVNGNNLSGATITVSPSVARNVTLRNFRSSNIRIANVPNTNSSINTVNNGVFASVRSAFGGIFRSDSSNPQGGSSSTSDKFKKLGDGAVPIKLEGCTITKIEAEKDIVLYLDKGDKKSTINEVDLKAGLKDFTFAEFDDNGKEVADKAATASENKSKIENLKIEDNGIEKINLIGGVISDVSFADNIDATAVDSLKYDKEFSDQFGAEAKSKLLDVVTVKEDIGVAKHDTNSGAYKFTMSKALFAKVNGAFSIMFLKNQGEGVNNQVTSLQSGTPISSIASFSNPVYLAIPAGTFKVDYTGSEEAGTVKTIYGTEWAYVDYAHAFARGLVWNYGLEDIVVLDHYRNYNKKAFVVKILENDVEIYVNMAEIKKDDVICCAYKEDGAAYGENASKLTELDLAGYKPYFTFSKNYLDYLYGKANPSPDNNADPAVIQQYNTTHNDYFAVFQDGSNPLHALTYNTSSQQQGTIEFYPPYGASIKLGFELMDCTISAMTSESVTYPDNIPESYPSITTPHYGTTELHELQRQDFTN